MAQPLGNRLPGIVVTITADAGLIAPFGFERFPCIIGKGDIEIPKERNLVVSHETAGGTDSLPDSAQTIYQIGAAPGIITYDEIRDYTHTAGTNAIDWSPSGPSAKEPTAGTNYYVSYTVEMPTSAFEPILYLDEDLMLQERGIESIFSDTDLRNDLVTAARLAFKNGATGVIVAQLDFKGANTTIIPTASTQWADPLDPTGDEMSTAYDVADVKVDKIEEFKLWLVPLDPSSLPTVLDPLAEKTFPAGGDNNTRWYLHAIKASAPTEARERTVFGVVPQGTRLSSLLDTARGFRETGGGDRMVITGTKGLTDIEASAVAVSIFTRTGDIVPVSFLNAATAGLFSRSRIGAPNNSAAIGGVSVLDDWTIPEARVLRGGGVIPYKVRANLTRMIIPISTDTTSAFTEDLSVQDIADYLRGFIRLRLFDAFSNVNITADTEGSLIAALSSLLEGLIKDRILVAFTDIQATQRTDEPRKIDMRGKVKPAFPLRWIDVDLVFTANIS